jgi:hypothetical protein
MLGYDQPETSMITAGPRVDERSSTDDRCWPSVVEAVGRTPRSVQQLGRRTVEKTRPLMRVEGARVNRISAEGRSATVPSRTSLRLRMLSDSWLAEVPP